MDPANERETGQSPVELKKNCTIMNKLGLHARAAALFVQTANSFPCEIFFGKDGNEVNGKSILGILTLSASKGTHVSVRAVGTNAEAAIDRLCELIENKFGEE